MLLRHCEARPYATYGYKKHRRHIHRPLVVLRVGLCAAIFTKCGCRQLFGDRLHTTLVNCYIVTLRNVIYGLCAALYYSSVSLDGKCY